MPDDTRPTKRRRQSSSDEVQYYDWRLSRWLTSETRERLDASGRGMYRELLDHCYAQGDFPEDAEWISRKCACSVRDFNKWWPIIERHFPKSTRDGYRHNTIASIWRKQYFSLCKTNRKNGKTGADKRRVSKDMPSDRLPTAEQPLERPDGPSLSEASTNRIEEKRIEENKDKTTPPVSAKFVDARWKSDVEFMVFVVRYRETGASLIDKDFHEAWMYSWRLLDRYQKPQRLKALDSHLPQFKSDPSFVPRPLKYLETEWERSPKGKREQEQLPESIYTRV